MSEPLAPGKSLESDLRLIREARGFSREEIFNRVHIRPEVLAQVEAQTHRRFLKSHLPADALLMSPKAKYIFLARDGKDVAISIFVARGVRSHISTPR